MAIFFMCEYLNCSSYAKASSFAKATTFAKASSFAKATADKTADKTADVLADRRQETGFRRREIQETGYGGRESGRRGRETGYRNQVARIRRLELGAIALGCSTSNRVGVLSANWLQLKLRAVNR